MEPDHLYPPALKNLPTTWGLRLHSCSLTVRQSNTLKNLPTTWGLRLVDARFIIDDGVSEKPPHHMGIKTIILIMISAIYDALKNLPTTWGLRLTTACQVETQTNSEKPPHHMGIKTF